MNHVFYIFNKNVSVSKCKFYAFLKREDGHYCLSSTNVDTPQLRKIRSCALCTVFFGYRCFHYHTVHNMK